MYCLMLLPILVSQPPAPEMLREPPKEVVPVEILPPPGTDRRTAILEHLTTNIENRPELRGVVLTGISDITSSDGLELVRVTGSIPHEEVRQRLKERCILVLKVLVETGKLAGGPYHVDVAALKVRTPPQGLELLLAIEQACPSLPARLVRPQLFAPDRGELILTGIVENDAALKQVITALARVPGVTSVDGTNVLIRQGTGPLALRPSDTFFDAREALGRGEYGRLLESSTNVARNAVPNSSAAVSAWYLRAAAHLSTGRRQEAAGDLRVAQALAEQLVGADPYYTTLERFQGPGRIALSNLLREGPRALLVTPR